MAQGSFFPLQSYSKMTLRKNVPKLANGLKTVLPNEDATLLIGLRILSMMMPLPLCLCTNLPTFG